MNKTASEAAEFLKELAPKVKGAKCNVVACVPMTDLAAAVRAAKKTGIKIGAQNLHFEKSGAFTGEVSADMLLDLGVEYVIIGHSERRQYFGETDETVNKKLTAALAAGLKPIVCVGELLKEREDGITEEILRMQTKLAFKNISAEDAAGVIIAYEPVWAIGTGLTATAGQADEACGIIRDTIASLYGKKTAGKVVIQYGGSMNAKNAAELLAMKNVDGGLIGGASLKSDDFTAIVNSVPQKK